MLHRDVNVHLQEDWLAERDGCNDSITLSNFFKFYGRKQKQSPK